MVHSHGHPRVLRGPGQGQPAAPQRAAVLRIGDVEDDGLQPRVARRVEQHLSRVEPCEATMGHWGEFTRKGFWSHLDDKSSHTANINNQ